MIVFFTEFYKGMQLFGNKISMIINNSLLIFVYILGIGTTSIIAKLFGKYFLKLHIEKEIHSYWNDSQMTEKKESEFLKQY